MKLQFLSAPQVKKMIPARPAEAHKGQSGHVLILAGSRGMSGAAVLAALGALRGGAGLVTVATVEAARTAIAQELPEALTLPLPDTGHGVVSADAFKILENYLEFHSVDAVAAGPGLTVHPDAARVLRLMLKEWKMPLVLDADGLNNLNPQDLKDYPQLIITPHPLELARFLKVNRDVVKQDRARIAQQVARDHNLTCVLKGHHTVIADVKNTRMNPTGNQAMATGGMGDVLTGLIVSLLAQGLTPFEASCAGVYLHGLAGDLARVSDRGLLAREVAHAIPQALRKIGVH